MKKSYKFVSILFLLFLALTVFVSPVLAQFEKVKERINKIIVEESVPSIAVAVAKDGEIIWEEGFGWANREKRIKSDEHTMYSLASISKPLTATGLMILVERGKIDLDNALNDYLGTAKMTARVGNAEDATVKRVASHTAGLPLHYQFFYDDEPYIRPSMDESIRRYANLVTGPGERYQYSNLGFGILDYVISRISGKSYPDFMRQEVFIPLGMTRTSVDIGPGLENFHAERYGTDGTPIPFYDFDHPGGSAVYSSAHDLVRFGMFHLKNNLPDQKKIISDNSIDLMHTAVDPAPYGIGWRIGEVNGVRRISHTGGMGGVSTSLVLLPEYNIVSVVLTNFGTRYAGTVQNEILKALLPEKFGNSSSGNPDPPKGDSLDELKGKWDGIVDTYMGELKIYLEIENPDMVKIRLGDQRWTLLNSVTYINDYLRGNFNADIGTEDVNRRPYYLRLELKKRGDILNGSLIGMSLPGKKVGNALTHWVELKKN